MITKLTLNKSEETFNLLGDYFPGFNKDRALNGIGLRLKSQSDYENYAADLHIAIAKAEKEQLKLGDMRGKYNYKFPSNDKKCLTTPHVLYNTIRSSISEMKKNILKFCPKNTHRAAGTYTTSTQTLGNSYLCNRTPYSVDLYPEMYPDYVNNVLGLLEEYNQVASENLSICQELLDEEQRFRDDDDVLKEIDADSRRESENITSLMNKAGLLTAKGISKEDLERRKKEAKNMAVLRRQLYHNITPDEYIIKVVKDLVIDGLTSGLTSEESVIWTKEEDYDFVKQCVRPAIEKMCKKDNLPSHKKRKETGRVIKADYIACFMEWCRVNTHKQEFFYYLLGQFDDSPLLLPQYKSILGAAKKKLPVNTKNQYVSDFESYSEN